MDDEGGSSDSDGGMMSAVLENKNLCDDLEKLILQLKADTIVCLGKMFVQNVFKWQSDKLFACNSLTAYGILFTRSGSVGLLKFKMNFRINQASFKEIVPFRIYLQIPCMKIFDYIFHYVMEKLQKNPNISS